MPGICWTGGTRSCMPMLLLWPFGSGGSGTKLGYVLPTSDSLVHGEVGEGRNGGLPMEVRVSMLLRDLLGVLVS
jgi:hypothetical protein